MAQEKSNTYSLNIRLRYALHFLNFNKKIKTLWPPGSLWYTQLNEAKIVRVLSKQGEKFGSSTKVVTTRSILLTHGICFTRS